MTVRVGVLGAGTVGGALVARLLSDRDAIRIKSGVDLEVRLVAVRDVTNGPSPYGIWGALGSRAGGEPGKLP